VIALQPATRVLQRRELVIGQLGLELFDHLGADPFAPALGTTARIAFPDRREASLTHRLDQLENLGARQSTEIANLLTGMLPTCRKLDGKKPILAPPGPLVPMFLVNHRRHIRAAEHQGSSSHDDAYHTPSISRSYFASV